VSRKPTPTRGRCPVCGTESEPESARCPICGHGLGATEPETGIPARAPGEPEKADPSVHGASPANVLDLVASAEPREPSLPELLEIHTAARRIETVLALLPVLGAFRIWKSELHTRLEKWLLSVASVGFGLALALPLAARIVWSEPPEHDIEADLEILAELVERYRAEWGTYPDPQAWEQAVERGDPRFFDPWGRPYRYELRKEGFAIATLGRDGRPGGEGADRDRVAEFPHP
jgi:hypothetical protein